MNDLTYAISNITPFKARGLDQIHERIIALNFTILKENYLRFKNYKACPQVNYFPEITRENI